MYIGKHRGRESDPIHIPENYAGSAFCEREETLEEETHHSADAKEDMPCLLPACKQEEDRHGGFLPHFEKLFSSDALLILLAIMLSKDEDGGELAMILLLLLLF